MVFTEVLPAGSGGVAIWEWRYSYTDPGSSPDFNFGNQIPDVDATLTTCSAYFNVTYYCWRYVSKNVNYEANSNVIKVTVTPIPKPIGIFFE